MKTSSALLLSVAAFGLSACAFTPNTQDHARSVAEAHPITVDQQTVALRLPIDETRDGLSRASLSQIDSLVSRYRTRGHGPVTVTAPVGGASDRAAQEAAANVRAALFASGVPYDAMTGASVRTRDTGDAVIVSFQSFVATGPSCGRETDKVSRRLRNLGSEGFGCATQANLAAMIADPRDLHGGASADGTGDGDLTQAVVTRAIAQNEVITYELEAGE